MMFYGLKHLQLAEYAAIVFATPFFVAAFSPLLIGESVRGHTWIAIAIGFGGVLLVLRPTPDHFEMAHLVTVTMALGVGLLVLTVRHLSITENAITLNFYLYPLNILVSGWWAYDQWRAPTAVDWLLMIALGACATLALGCFIQAMRYARPATVAPLDYLRLVWTVTLGWLIWDELPDLPDWIGIALVSVAGIYLVRQMRVLPEMGEGVDPDREGQT
jgi:drug/metabolite transporter (DMT)-like permease